jgi:hypothetical protein
MLTFKNIKSGKVVPATGCWLDHTIGGIAFMFPACHSLLDWDSPIKFDLNPIAIEDEDGDVYEVFPFPDGWVIVGT